MAGLNFLTENIDTSKSVQSIGVVLGFNPIECEDKIASAEVTVINHREFSQLIQLALSERVDAIYGDPKVLKYYLGVLGLPLDMFTFSTEHPYSVHEYYISTIDQHDLIEKLNHWVKINGPKVSNLKKEYEVE